MINTGTPQAGPSPGIALCLSGGGYRAMLFHVGALCDAALRKHVQPDLPAPADFPYPGVGVG